MGLLATSAVTLFGAALVATTSPAIASNMFALQSTAKNNTNTNSKVVKAERPAPAPVPPAPKIVTVQTGDSLTKLAEVNDTTTLRMYYANTNIVDPDVIHPNEAFRIPTAEETLAERPVPVNEQIAVPTQPESTQAAAPQQADGSVWDRLAACEAGGNWSINTGNGFYGGLQFTQSSWNGVGGSGQPNLASRDEQIVRGQMLQAKQGWGAWPACSAKLGLN